MEKNKLLAVFFMLCCISMAFAGEGNRYMVFFTDKPEEGYSADHPDAFLSQKALKRREKQNIAIDETDLPISNAYLRSLTDIDGVNLFFKSKWLNGVLVETGEVQLAEISSLSFVKNIEYVAPGYKLSVSGRIGKNSRNAHSYMIEVADTESGAQNAFIGVDDMHERGYKGEGMLIAVFDSGFEFVDDSPFYEHIFSDGQVVGERDFVRNSGDVFQYDSHGSKVLSCISAYEEGVYSGTAPEAGLVLCVTEDVNAEYRIEEYNWLFAAEYADSIGVDIINSSVGYSYFNDENMDYTYEDLDGKTTVITKAAAHAANKGMLVVCSNGNEGNNSWTYLNAPADADSILSIGAVTYDEVRSSFSSYGPSSDGRIKPDISALGTWVRVVHKDEITYANGTSFSTPLTSGLAAGFWQAFPQLTNMEVMEYLKMSASQADAPDTLIGYGVPNFVRAFNLAQVNEGNIENKFVVFPNPVTNKRTIYLYSEKNREPDVASLAFYDLKGSMVSNKNVRITKAREMFEVDVSFLTPGTYILNYISGKEKQKIKLVVL
jgi:subtilisin family serine protease